MPRPAQFSLRRMLFATTVFAGACAVWATIHVHPQDGLVSDRNVVFGSLLLIAVGALVGRTVLASLLVLGALVVLGLTVPPI